MRGGLSWLGSYLCWFLISNIIFSLILCFHFSIQSFAVLVDKKSVWSGIVCWQVHRVLYFTILLYLCLFFFFFLASRLVGLSTCIKLTGGPGCVRLHFMGVETAYYLASEQICEFCRLLRWWFEPVRPLKVERYIKRYPEELLNDGLAPVWGLSVSVASACCEWLQPELTLDNAGNEPHGPSKCCIFYWNLKRRKEKTLWCRIEA